VTNLAGLAWQGADQTAGQADGNGETLLPHVYLHPGQLYIATEPAVVNTILGSCVSVCLWSPELGIGGINHYLLPTGLKTSPTALRYGNVAIELLVEKLLRVGCRLDRLQGKVFGGACVLDAMRGKGSHLGMKNAEIAMSALTAIRIPIMGSDVGGNRGRKLLFHPHDGSALVKLL
jgi:chemotaxis protein CheD